jgi:hypothetical protein
MDERVILKRWSVRLLVIAAVLGMLTLLGYAMGNKEAPSDSTHADSTITDAVIPVDSSETTAQDTSAKMNDEPDRQPFPPTWTMSNADIILIDSVEYARGDVTVRSAADSILLIDNGFYIYGRSQNQRTWKYQDVTYTAHWPLDFDFNTIFDHVLDVRFESRTSYPPHGPTEGLIIKVDTIDVVPNPKK